MQLCILCISPMHVTVLYLAVSYSYLISDISRSNTFEEGGVIRRKAGIIPIVDFWQDNLGDGGRRQ